MATAGKVSARSSSYDARIALIYRNWAIARSYFYKRMISSEGISSSVTWILCDESNPSNEMVQMPPSVIALITPIYHFVVPSSSSSISTFTLFFKRNGCLSPAK